MKIFEGKGKKGAAAAVIAAAVVLVVYGTGNRENEPVEVITTVETAAEIVQPELPVNEQEAKLLSDLYKSISMSGYAETAKLLNENEEVFEKMMTDTLADEKYLYKETEYENGQIICTMELLPDEEVTGMVLTRYNTVFYGTFVDGKPNGTCAAIQAMILDEPRYSFAVGNWKDGKMNGEGKTGYHYYLNAPESGFIRTDKEGTYLDNLLDGEFVYRTESGGGEVLTWKMQATKGVTDITERWTHYPFRKEYMLGSEEDEGRAYVLTEEKAVTVLWNNLIIWKE